MISLLLAGLLASAPVQEVPQGDMTGAAGVCIRWERNARRVKEAVVVTPSGNSNLDRSLPRAIPRMDWPVGIDDNRGQWVGIWYASGGAETPAGALPDCSALRDRSWAPPAPAN